MNGLARRLGLASARRPRITLAAWALLLVLLTLLAARAGGTFRDDLRAPGSESTAATDLLASRFPAATGGSALVVFAPPDDRALGGDDLAAVDAALDRLRDLDHVAHVSDPVAAGTISPDGRVAFAEVHLDVPDHALGPEGVAAIADALAPAHAAGLRAEAGGDAILVSDQPETSGAEAVGVLAALVVLVVAFGSVVAAVVPVALALTAVGVGIATVTLLARVTAISSDGPTIATMIGLGVGIDYALFLVARYREERRRGRPDAEALAVALGSSGAAVVFAGGTVVVAMAGLLLTGIGVLGSIGLAASLVVLVAVAAALTLLPAVLTLLGPRIDRGRVGRRGRGRPRSGGDAAGSGWWRFAHRVAGRPWPSLLASTAVLLALAAPALAMQLGYPDAGSEPRSSSQRRAYDLLAAGFGPGFNGPLLLVVDGDEHDVADLGTVAARAAADPGVLRVGPPSLAPAGDAAVLPVIPTTGPAEPQTRATIARLRSQLPDGVLVTGLTATIDDLTAQLAATLPRFIGAVVVVSFLLLVLVFRSLVVPLKAAIMNLLSIAGAYGVMVAVFQWGWGAGALGLEGPVAIVSFVPILMFAVLFGLSMDYEVFLLSRIREEHATADGDEAEAVARGLAGTGRVITSAALIMVSVFASFVASPSPILKMVGLGLATAIALDATLVRMVVVPATMVLMGRANWWLPRWLDRVLPHVEVDPPAAPTATEPAAHAPAAG